MGGNIHASHVWKGEDMNLVGCFRAPLEMRCPFFLPSMERRIDAAAHIQVSPELAARGDLNSAVKE